MVICIAGGIGSGKTEVAQRLSSHLGCGAASFGNYVRSIARRRGLPQDREQLQEIGEALVTDSLREFCVGVLAQADWKPEHPLILEGIRHVEALRAVQDLVAPCPVRLIYLATSDELRTARLAASRPDDAAHLHELDLHSTETQVKRRLRDAADMVLDGSLSIDDLVGQIDEWLSTLA